MVYIERLVGQLFSLCNVLYLCCFQTRNENSILKVVMPSPPPPPLYPKATKKLKITDIKPLELARQLTLMESSLYRKIKFLECLQRTREQKVEIMDNITNVIQMSNRVSTSFMARIPLVKDVLRSRIGWLSVCLAGKMHASELL